MVMAIPFGWWCITDVAVHKIETGAFTKGSRPVSQAHCDASGMNPTRRVDAWLMLPNMQLSNRADGVAAAAKV
jgi:hypothetical protein